LGILKKSLICAIHSRANEVMINPSEQSLDFFRSAKFAHCTAPAGRNTFATREVKNGRHLSIDLLEHQLLTLAQHRFSGSQAGKRLNHAILTIRECHFSENPENSANSVAFTVSTW